MGSVTLFSAAPMGLMLALLDSQWTRTVAQLENASENPRCFMRALRVQGCPLLVT